MFDPELLGLTASQYIAFASVISLPAIGFVFLFLLGRPLAKLPFLDADPDYKPPKWVLPTFAIGSLFAISFSLSSYFFLNYLTAGNLPIKDFMNSFVKQFSFHIKKSDGPIKTATVTVVAYDGDSDFEILTNNYLVFGSELNCLMIYQCNTSSRVVNHEQSSKNLLKQVNRAALTDKSIHNIHRLYTIPHSEVITGYLAPGMNHLDVISGNSGRGDCALEVVFTFEFSEHKRTTTVKIAPGIGSSQFVRKDGNVLAQFMSGGNSPSLDSMIPPYRTYSAHSSYRLCERVRLDTEVDTEALPTNLRSIKQWSDWASDRWADTLCGVYNGKAYCRSETAH